VVTDLDGTLLDHHDYRWDKAQPAINRLQALGVPILFNTSKTFDEAHRLQQQIGVDGPLIVENGSALLLPRDMLKKSQVDELMDDVLPVSSQGDFLQFCFGSHRAVLLETIKTIRQQHDWQFAGFNDWSIEQIQAQTDLSPEQAAMAANKQFSEPFIWQDTPENLALFAELIAEQGLKLLKGGRFYHLQGDTTKAKPIEWLKRNMVSLFGVSPSCQLLCLGDNHNDIDMLNVADVAVCIKSPVAPYPTINNSNQVVYTQAEGPAGWNEAIQQLLDSHTHS